MYPVETEIMLLLKKESMTLDELSKKLSISKMAVLNHINKLEKEKIIKRNIIKKDVGRPVYKFSLTDLSKDKISNSYGKMLDDLLEYLYLTENSKIVEEFLKTRYSGIKNKYSKDMAGLENERRVKELFKLRENEGYYPEINNIGDGKYELLEYNCPIFKLANKFGKACSMETKLFSSVLDMNVTSTHRQVNGYDVCRFIIGKNKELKN